MTFLIDELQRMGNILNLKQIEKELDMENKQYLKNIFEKEMKDLYK